MVSSKSSPSRSVVGLASPNRSRIAHLVEFVATVFTLASVLGFAPARRVTSPGGFIRDTRHNASSRNTASSPCLRLAANPPNRSFSPRSAQHSAPRHASSPSFFLRRVVCDRNTLEGTSPNDMWRNEVDNGGEVLKTPNVFRISIGVFRISLGVFGANT